MNQMISGDGTSLPPSAILCHKCNKKALVIMDGFNFGYSKWVTKPSTDGVGRHVSME